LFQHLRTNAVTASAIAVALSGMSIALVALPHNSIGTKQIKKHAVHKSDLHKESVTAAKIAPGAIRIDATATSLVSGAIPSAAPDRVLLSITIRTATTGRVFAFGRGLYSVTCATPGTAIKAGLYIDGAAISGSGAALPANGSPAEINVFGLSGAHLAPGTHTLQLKSDCATGDSTAFTAVGDAALGGFIAHD
jgi:hypothetical protein